MIIILMGVSGSGKTTVGRYLAQQLGWKFYEGDDFHPSANINKMMRGIPLTDGDRQPWLQELHRLVERLQDARESAVIACSALKQAYRETLQGAVPGVRFVYLQGDPELLRQRLEQRQRHFMSARLLDSQLAALEVPADAVTVTIDQPPEAIARAIAAALQLGAEG